MVRELRPALADPFSLLFGMVQPLVFLALFGPLLAGSVGAVTGGGTVWQWFVPSILVMTVLFVTSTTGANLLFELQTGAHEHMLVTPLSRSSLLFGLSLKEMAPLAGQALVIILVMLPFGFRTRWARWSASRCSRSSASGWGPCATRWRSRCAGRTGCSGLCSRRCSTRS